MGDYGRLSNFNPRNSFNKVRFGADTPLLETELNEAQQIQEYQRKEITKASCGDLFRSQMSYSNGKFTLSESKSIINGEFLHITPLSKDIIEGEVIYLEVATENIKHTSEIKSNGNSQSTKLEFNNLMDSRLMGVETARREQTVYNLFVERGQGFDSCNYYLPLAEIKNGELVKLIDPKYTSIEINEMSTPIDKRVEGTMYYVVTDEQSLEMPSELKVGHNMGLRFVSDDEI